MITIPRRILSSALMRQGGCARLAGLFPDGVLDALRREAALQRPSAQAVTVARSDGDMQRGGNPARKFLSAPGTALLNALYADPSLQQTVAAAVGAELVPVAAGSGGSFTYYCRKGDFLAIHRDVIACDVALITCLEDSGARGSAGKLCMYPTRIWEPLAELRRDPMRDAQPVRLSPGETAVLLGGVVPHCTLPVAEGQCRIVSLLCYRVRVH